MADTKFKVGERVRIKKGSEYAYQAKGTDGTVRHLDRPDGWTRVKWDCGYEDNYPNDDLAGLKGKVPKAAPLKFILQYELDADPFEFFATEKEARKRIAELAEKPDLKRDSIRLIEIKKIRTVKLGVKISISK